MHALPLISVLLAGYASSITTIAAERATNPATNAAWFALGLPPLPPTRRFNSLAPRASVGLCTSTKTITGLIEATDKTSGASYGYVTTDYYIGYGTLDPTENLRTVSITLPFFLKIITHDFILRGTDDHPYWGAIMSHYATNNDMSTANDKSVSDSSLPYSTQHSLSIGSFAWMGTTDLTGKVPTVTENSPQDAQGAEQAGEMPIVGSVLYATGNPALLAARLNRPDVDAINHRLVQIPIVIN
ncbi:hypothetical protein C8R43DRAFT_1237810 [Mycena crocata]|nr:hypothetical protein C8R43DRAFT_1237810 [Mycena crocata]